MENNLHISTASAYNRANMASVNAFSFFASAGTAKSRFHQPFIQPKLAINPVNDAYEQEADSVANHVMRMPANGNSFFKPVSNFVQRMCDCGKEEKINMKGEGSLNGSSATSDVESVVHSAGQPLDADTRNFMESRFGYDFGNVQIHNDSFAHHSSADINALAYTHQNHIVFGEGQYRPQSDEGRYLLAHELTHVVQQQHSPGKVQRLVRKTEIKDCAGFSDNALGDLAAAEQKAFDLLRTGIDKIQAAEDEYTQAMHKYSGPTLKQLQEFQQAFEVGTAFRSAFGVSANSTESWDKLHIVKIRFMEVLRWLDHVVFQYICEGSGEMCPANRFAFVDTNKDHRTIHLCPKFWESGLTVRGHTIAHEIMHLWGGGFMKDTIEKVFGIEKVTPRFQDVNRYESFLRLITK